MREPDGSRSSLAQRAKNLRHSPARSGLALGLGLALLLTGTHAGANLLLNGNFNTAAPSGGAYGWTTWSSPDWNLAWANRQTDENSVDGTAYMAVGNGNGLTYSEGLFQTVPVTGGLLYQLSVDSGAQNWWRPEGEMRLSFLDATNGIVARSVVVTVDPFVIGWEAGRPWDRFFLRALAPSNATQAKVELVMNGGGVSAWGAGTVWFDNADLSVAAPLSFLHASGTTILDRDEQVVLLRGVNLGSWLAPELWMIGDPNLSGYPGADDYEKLNAAVLDVVGGDNALAAQALGAMRSNFITAADIVFLHNQGFNSLRVPFHYALFYQVTNAALSFPTNGLDVDTGFSYLDNLLAWCATNQVYVIPCMHVVPGGHDYAVAGNVFTNASNHAMFLHIWQQVAARYATNPWVGGYDLINEPVYTTGGYSLIPSNYLSQTYADARNVIRAVDSNHMLICDGDWYATTLSQINTTSWYDSNVCYSDHRYGDVLPFSTERKWGAIAADVPLWMGEFGYNSDHWNNYAVADLEQADTLTADGRTATLVESWCYWSYKAPLFCMLVENPQTAGWKALTNYWNSPATVPRPSVTNAYDWLLEFAQAAAFSNCLVHKEVVDGLTRPHASFAGQRVPYRAGMTIPGRIMATDFDMGANGVAYNDTVYDDESDLGVGGRAWNDGWYGRDDGVDTFSCTDESTLLKVGANLPGEWQRYTVSSVPGTYNLNLRYGATTNGRLHVLVNGVNVSGPINLPVTGGLTSYTTITLSNVVVSASGAATVEIDCDAGGYDLLWVEFQPVSAPPLAPGSFVASAGNAAVSLCWSPSSGAASYSVKRATNSGGPYTLIGSTLSTGYQDTGLANETTYYYVVCAVIPSGAGTDSLEASATPQASTLPAGWVSRDVGLSTLWNGDAGDVGFAGSATFSGDTFTLAGSGIDISDTADSFQYAFRAVAGDCTIVADVAGLANTDPWAKAGLMVRETLQFDSANVLMSLSAQNGTLFSSRSATSAGTLSVASSGAAPCWLKLVRTGNTFTGYSSANGTDWTQVGTAAFTLASNVLVGLALTAHNNLLLNTATFDNVSVSAQLPPAPAGLGATASDRRVSLQWPAVPSANSYLLNRSTTSGGSFASLAAGLMQTNYLDLDVTNNTTYYYVVSALDLNGESPPSTQAAATPRALAPFTMVAQVTNHGLLLSWPADYTGCRLAVQTNAAGLGTNWLDAGVVSNPVLLPIDPANHSVFYRLWIP